MTTKAKEEKRPKNVQFATICFLGGGAGADDAHVCSSARPHLLRNMEMSSEYSAPRMR